MKTGLRDLYDARIMNAYMQGYGEPEHEFEKFYVTEEITTEDTRYSYISGLGMWQLKPFGGNVAFDSVYQGYDVTCTPTTYALAFTLEKETVDDDPHGLLGQNLATNLAQMGRETIEVLAAQPFNNATSATSFAPWSSSGSGDGYLGNGQPLLSTVHPVLSGGTFANAPAAHVDPGYASIQTALLRGAAVTGARGQQYPITFKNIVYPTTLRFIIGEILTSSQVPYTADNTKNQLYNGLNPQEWSRLTNTSMWFLNAGKPSKIGEKGIQTVCVMRQRPKFDRDNVFTSGDRRYKGDMRLGFTAVDQRGWDGSK